MRKTYLTIAVLASLLLGSMVGQPRASAERLLTPHTEYAAQASDFEQLQDRFQKLYRSLRGKGGYSEQDLALIGDLRDRFAQFNTRNPGHEGGLAGELQVSLWLDDHDRVNHLFRQLVLANPDNAMYGPAWISFLERTDQNDRVPETFDWLIENVRNTSELLVMRAKQYKRESNYPRALEMLERTTLDPATHYDGLLLKADCLAAENRFDEALAVINSITPELIAANPRRRGEIDRNRRNYDQLADLWRRELELQSTESAADDLPRVELITAQGRIVLELFEDAAPNTVANFITLVEDGFYDNTRFHRVEPEFVTQGGDPNTRPDAEGTPGTGGPGYRIADEWELEGARKHFAGSLAMAHSGADTAGSQFYITHRPAVNLNRGYTVFGRVLTGLDAARAMQRDDELISARVLRKREHEYEVEKLRSLEEIEEDLPSFLRTTP